MENTPFDPQENENPIDITELSKDEHVQNEQTDLRELAKQELDAAEAFEKDGNLEQAQVHKDNARQILEDMDIVGIEAAKDYDKATEVKGSELMPGQEELPIQDEELNHE